MSSYPSVSGSFWRWSGRLCAPRARSQVREFAIIDDWQQRRRQFEVLKKDEQKKRLLGDLHATALPDAFLHEVLGTPT